MILRRFVASIVLIACGVFWAGSPICLWLSFVTGLGGSWGLCVLFLQAALITPIATILLLTIVKRLCACSTEEIVAVLPRFMHGAIQKLLSASFLHTGIFACCMLFVFGLNWAQAQEDIVRHNEDNRYL